MLRGAIRAEEKLRIACEDGNERRTRRTVKPLGLFYYIDP
jgi:predicted DNA-binding transcriptional regulator YafY